MTTIETIQQHPVYKQIMADQPLELIQYTNGKRLIHGAGDNVSELIKYYYKHRAHYGKMTIEDASDNNRTLATMDGKITLQ